jgi:hypothetical protein
VTETEKKMKKDEQKPKNNVKKEKPNYGKQSAPFWCCWLFFSLDLLLICQRRRLWPSQSDT